MMEKEPNSLRNQTVYQVFLRNYKDGTFVSLMHDLARIKDLGMDWIYLLPFYLTGEEHRKGTLGSPYAIQDYRDIDPACGTMEEFRQFVEAAHQYGIRVMIDIVYNHTSPDSLLAKEHPDWFYHKPDGKMGNRVGEWWDVVDLDYRNPGLWEYQIDTLKQWAGYVDGFRCDVAPMVPLEFWKKARQEVSTINSDMVWLAESVEPEFIGVLRDSGINAASDGELYTVFDLCYDYDIYRIQQQVQLGELPLERYAEAVNYQLSMMPDQKGRLRFLENHDRPRAAALLPSETVLKSWTAWSYFVKGTVLVYAGQEYRNPHHPTLFDKDIVKFDTGYDDSKLLQRLHEIKQDPLFRESGFQVKALGPDRSVLYAVHTGRSGTASEGRKAIGVFPMSGRPGSIKVELNDGTYTDRISGRKIDVFEQVLQSDGLPVILFLDHS